MDLARRSILHSTKILNYRILIYWPMSWTTLNVANWIYDICQYWQMLPNHIVRWKYIKGLFRIIYIVRIKKLNKFTIFKNYNNLVQLFFHIWVHWPCCKLLLPNENLWSFEADFPKIQYTPDYPRFSWAWI